MIGSQGSNSGIKPVSYFARASALCGLTFISLIAVEVVYASDSATIQNKLDQELNSTEFITSEIVDNNKTDAEFHSKDFNDERLSDKLRPSASPSETMTANQIDDSERGKLRMIHELMTARLMVALNVSVPSPTQLPMNIHSVAQLPSHLTTQVLTTHPKNLVQTVKRTVIRRSLKPKSQPPAEPVQLAQRPMTIKSPERKIASLTRAIEEPAVKEEATNPKLSAEVERTQYWNSFPALFKPRPTDLADEPEFQDPESVNLALLERQLTEMQFGIMNLHMQTLKDPNSPEDKSPLTMQALALANPSQNEMNTHSDQVVVATQAHPIPPQAVSAQKATRSIPTTASKNEYPTQAIAAQTATPSVPVTSKVELPEVENPPAQVQEEKPEALQETIYVEAFTKSETPIQGVSKEMRTIESLSESGNPEGWELASAVDHWPTMRWVDPTRPIEQVPMVHQKMLAGFTQFFGINQQAGNGIVNIKTASGWEVAFSRLGTGTNPDQSAADQPVYFDIAGNYAGRDSMGNGGTTAFFNAAPGFRVVYLTLRNTHNPGSQPLSAAIAFPVLPGVMIYLDLTHPNIGLEANQIKLQEMNGKVVMKNNTLLGESSKIVNATVRVFGQDAAVAKVGEDGYFEIKNLLTFSNYPLYAEVEAVEKSETLEHTVVGLTHRYEILPYQMQKLHLIRYSREKMQNFIDQLPNGVSDKNGYVIANISKISSTYPNLTLTPAVESVLPVKDQATDPAHWGPKTCPLSNDDRIEAPRVTRSISGEVNAFVAPLQSDEHRFAGFEVPEGLVEAKVTDQNNSKIWSTFFPASPDVVNVLRAKRSR